MSDIERRSWPWRGTIHTETHYAYAPLARLLPPGLGSRRTADLLGVSQRQVVRWRSGAWLREGTADRCATALGLHPSAIW